MNDKLRVAALAVIVIAWSLACGDTISAPDYDVRDEVEITGHNYRRDSIGSLIIEGEIKNNGPHVWQFVKLSATGYDADDNVVDTGTGYADTQRLRVGDTSTFDIYIHEEGRGIVRYKIDVIDGLREK